MHFFNIFKFHQQQTMWSLVLNFQTYEKSFIDIYRKKNPNANMTLNIIIAYNNYISLNILK